MKVSLPWWKGHRWGLQIVPAHHRPHLETLCTFTDSDTCSEHNDTRATFMSEWWASACTYQIGHFLNFIFCSKVEYEKDLLRHCQSDQNLEILKKYGLIVSSIHHFKFPFSSKTYKGPGNLASSHLLLNGKEDLILSQGLKAGSVSSLHPLNSNSDRSTVLSRD